MSNGISTHHPELSEAEWDHVESLALQGLPIRFPLDGSVVQPTMPSLGEPLSLVGLYRDGTTTWRMSDGDEVICFPRQRAA